MVARECSGTDSVTAKRGKEDRIKLRPTDVRHNRDAQYAHVVKLVLIARILTMDK